MVPCRAWRLEHLSPFAGTDTCSIARSFEELGLATPPSIRIGIAGAGHFGRYHALKVAASARARLVGVHDIDAERAGTVGWEAGAPAMDLAALLAACDALIVAAPAEAHYALAAAALRAGKHVHGGEADRRHPRPG